MIKIDFGHIGEYFAIIIYKLMFYKIIAWRMRNYCGEIDIICKRFNQLVFVEVKSRSGNFEVDNPCSPYQVKRIKKAAELFLSQNSKFFGCNIRFDLVIIRANRFPKIIRNAW
jgi:putative endonuclease